MFQLGLLFIALFCAGIGTGSAYTTFFEFNPAGVTPSFWIAQLQHAIRRIGIPLFVVQPLAFLATAGSAALAWQDRPSFWFLALATVALLATALVTRVGHIPINRQILTWTPDAPPAPFAELQRRWWTLHIIRFGALVLGFAAQILGALSLHL